MRSRFLLLLGFPLKKRTCQCQLLWYMLHVCPSACKHAQNGWKAAMQKAVLPSPPFHCCRLHPFQTEETEHRLRCRLYLIQFTGKMFYNLWFPFKCRKASGDFTLMSTPACIRWINSTICGSWTNWIYVRSKEMETCFKHTAPSARAGRLLYFFAGMDVKQVLNCMVLKNSLRVSTAVYIFFTSNRMAAIDTKRIDIYLLYQRDQCNQTFLNFYWKFF